MLYFLYLFDSRLDACPLLEVPLCVEGILLVVKLNQIVGGGGGGAGVQQRAAWGSELKCAYNCHLH